ncbi:MAG: hypothetical protein OXG88_04940 [Gammaproteobacteria bacterium]|nr:hypothetical protein [Gammaproteobacteria bacterium]
MKYRELDNLIKQTIVSQKERNKLINRLVQVSEWFESLSVNRDGRGVKQSVRRLEKTTIRHINSALRLRDHHEDVQIRTKANKLIKSLWHLEFAEIAASASKFKGEVNKSSCRTNNRRQQKTARKIVVSDSLCLEEVRSLHFLQSVGRQLHLCVSDAGQARWYLNRIHQGKLELWVVNVEDEVTALLEVEIETERYLPGRRRFFRRAVPCTSKRIIVDCEGQDNHPIVLDFEEALQIVDCLNVDEVDTETFINIGAFPLFLRQDLRNSVPSPVSDGGEMHYVWQTPTSIVIASSTKFSDKIDKFVPEETGWSRFAFETTANIESSVDGKDAKKIGHWVEPGVNHLSLGNLLELMLKVPNFLRPVTRT